MAADPGKLLGAVVAAARGILTWKYHIRAASSFICVLRRAGCVYLFLRWQGVCTLSLNICILSLIPSWIMGGLGRDLSLVDPEESE